MNAVRDEKKDPGSGAAIRAGAKTNQSGVNNPHNSTIPQGDAIHTNTAYIPAIGDVLPTEDGGKATIAADLGNGKYQSGTGLEWVWDGELLRDPVNLFAPNGSNGDGKASIPLMSTRYQKDQLISIYGYPREKVANMTPKEIQEAILTAGGTLHPDTEPESQPDTEPDIEQPMEPGPVAAVNMNTKSLSDLLDYDVKPDVIQFANEQVVRRALAKIEDSDKRAILELVKSCGLIDNVGWALLRDEFNTRLGGKSLQVLDGIYRDAVKNARHKPVSKRIMHHLQGYKLAINDLDDSIQVDGRRLNDGDMATITTAIQDREPDIAAKRIEQAVYAYAGCNRFNPIKAGLLALPRWDGKDRFALLIAALHLRDPLEKQFFWRWKLGVIGKALHQLQNYMLVMDGEQGSGKSYFFRWDNPLGDNYHAEGAFDPQNKDHLLRMRTMLLHEIGELQAVTRKSDREALKSAITQKFISERQPYGRHAITKPVTVSFVGTINNTGAGFLNDPTGNRRYAIIRSDGIDWKYTQKIDKFQLWAQVLAAYEAGERGQLNEDEQAYQRTLNEEYEATPGVIDYFVRYFRVDPLSGDPESALSASHIVRNLQELWGLRGQDNLLKTQLEEHLNKLIRQGTLLERTRKRRPEGQVYVYPGVAPVETKDCDCVKNSYMPRKHCPKCEGRGFVIDEG